MTGRVVDHERKPLAGASVNLRSYEELGSGLPLAQAVTEEAGRFTFTDLSTSGVVMYWVSAPGRKPAARRIEIPSGRTTELGDIRLEPGEQGAPVPERREIRGRLLAPDRTGLRGCLVEPMGDRTVQAWTDAEGRFVLPRTLASVRGLVVHGPGRTWSIWGSGAERSTFAMGEPTTDLGAPVEVEMPEGRLVRLAAQGVPAKDVTFSAWIADRWVPLTGTTSWVATAGHGWTQTFRAEAPGHLPRVQRIHVADKADAAKGDAIFDFGESTRIELRVLDDDRPIPGASVDVCLAEGTGTRWRQPVATLRTDAEGRAATAVPPAGEYEAFVHAGGWEPARVAFGAGRTRDVTLAALTGTLRVPSIPAGAFLRIKTAGQRSPSAVVHGRETEQKVSLAAGSYEATWIDASEQVVRTVVATLVAGKETVLDLTRDDRPKIVLRLPAPPAGAGAWDVSGMEGVPSSGAVAWMITSGRDRRIAGLERAAVVEQQGPEQFVIRATASGRIVVTCSPEKLEHWFLAELDLAPAAQVELTLPPLDATLRGSMRTYRKAEDFHAHHGFAAPRLWLVARNRERTPAFDVVVPMPKRDGEHGFVVPHLPPGDFELHHHLIGETREYEGTGGDKRTYVRAVDAWGGVPVTVTSGKDTVVPELADAKPGVLTVKVLAAAGGPLRHGHVQIRDRMYESWENVVYGGTTLRFADDAIPEPPLRRLEGGGATFPSVRGGALHLRVWPEPGRFVDFVTDVDPARELVLRM